MTTRKTSKKKLHKPDPTGGYTARQAAYDIAMGWLSNAYNNRTSDVLGVLDDCSPSYRRRVRIQIAKLHNRLLDRSGLCGVQLDEEVPKGE